MAIKNILKALGEFVKTFPTATILYILLVLFSLVDFNFWWLIFAIIIDLADDYFGDFLKFV